MKFSTQEVVRLEREWCGVFFGHIDFTYKDT